MPENIQMICLVRLIVAAVCGLLIGVERQTRMKGAGSRTHDGFARCGTDDAGLLVWFSAYRGAARFRLMFLVWQAAGLTDGKGDLVRLYDWLEQRKITVREIDLKRQEGSSVKIVLFIAMPRHFDKADFLRLQEDIPGVQSVEI
ncbi:MAG: hypothetical protein ACLRVN_06460 [Butyricicoccus sp.]